MPAQPDEPPQALARNLAASARCRLESLPTSLSGSNGEERFLSVALTEHTWWLWTTRRVWVNQEPSVHGLVQALVVAPLGAASQMAMLPGGLSLVESGRPTRVIRAVTAACDMAIHGTGHGAWAVWRESPNGCFGNASSGVVRLLRVSQEGQVVGEARPLREQPIAYLRSRLDAGRLVIETRASNGDGVGYHTMVLDLAGESLSDSPRRDIVCPLSGCLGVIAARDAVRLSPDSARRGWQLPSIAAGSIEQLAVSGDRVLLVIRATSTSTLHMALINTRERRYEPVFDVSDGNVVNAWSRSATAGSLQVRSDRTGFIWSMSPSSGRIDAQHIDCEP